MLTLFFWNLNKKPLLSEIAEICRRYEVDILVLAEFSLSLANDLLLELNREISPSDPVYIFQYAPNPKVAFFHRYTPERMKNVLDEGGISIKEVFPPLSNSFLLVGVHLPSKLHMSEDDQIFQAMRLTEVISEAEGKQNHQRTILIGDLNMNPFEKGMVSSDALHAVMDQAIARSVSRKVQGREKTFFYNPMWSYMGDLSLGPPGTFYYQKSSYVNYFWHTFDQVLLRSEILESFSIYEINVLTETGSKSLVKGEKKIPCLSDHLPVLIRLKEIAISN